MIQVKHLNKYFNKGKQNSIHVINDTSFVLPETGLVTLLGESGSGKTTLLNVIGGLDKADGTIIFNNKEINKYNSKVWDQIRAHHIGYIFQNYHLLENKTVYENIELVLHMIGIVDAAEVEHRINYVLNAVSMFRFRNKLASDLSGGQKQRVAIARALVKNPEVIIADEPTGNLDSNNSIEILKIIKEISKDRLVVLVTHNLELANYYSDRIIKISDGKVLSDEINTNKGQSNLNYVDKNIYLQDLDKHEFNNVKIYSDTKIEDLELTLVKINNNFYLKTNNNNITIESLNKKTDINLIDAKKSEFDDKFSSETNFSIEELERIKTPRIRKKTFTTKDSIIEAFKKLSNLGRKAKLQIIALILLGINFAVGSFMLLSTIRLDYSKVYEDKNVHLVMEEKQNLYSDNLDKFVLYQTNNVNLIINFNSVNFNEQIKVLPIDAIKNEQIYPNKDVLNNNSIIIDESILHKQYEKSYIYHAYGLYNKNDLINRNVTLSNNGYNINTQIVGTVNTGTKAIYLPYSLLNLLDINQDNDHFALLKDFDESTINNNLNLPNNNEGKYEIYLNETFYGMEEEKLKNFDPNNNLFKIKGFFKDDSNNILLYIDEIDLQQYLYSDNIYKRLLTLYALKNIDDIKANNKLINRYDQQIENLKEDQAKGIASSLTQIIIALSISAVIFFFLVRSSLTKRIKEISILRSLGVSKLEVIKLFMFEYIIMTTFTSLIGVLIGAVFAKSINQSFLADVFTIRVEAFSFIITILAIYLVNVTIALIPVFSLLRKTPAEMLTNYDI